MKILASKLHFILAFLAGICASCSPTRDFSSFQKPGSRELGIIGGTSASLQDFPFIVNIWQNSPQDSFVDHLCGGSLIHPQWVLTAAHCVLQDVTDKSAGVIPLKEVTLYLGSLQFSGRGGRALKAKSIQVHPDFAWPKYDVALIELTEAVTDIAPIALSSQTPASGSLATVAGWGLVDEQGKVSAETLLKVSVPLVSREICNADPYVKEKHWVIEADMLCARTQGGQKASCAGDSGGPLVQNQNGKNVLVGVVSWGTACRLSYQGKQSEIEGYADVSTARPWIERQMSQSH